MMVGCALMTKASIAQIGQNTRTLVMNGKEENRVKRSTETRRCPAEIKANLQKHYGGMAERPVDKKASEEFNRPAYQARKLIRTQGEYLQEDPNK